MIKTLGEGNGNPLQYSCLENPMDGGAWWAAVHGVVTERLHFHFPLPCIGEGNGTPLQCSCLENPRDGGAWWAAVYGVAQSRTQLKRLSSSSSSKDLDSKDIHDTIREKLKWWKVVRKRHYLTEWEHLSPVVQRTEFLAGSPRVRACCPHFLLKVHVSPQATRKMPNRSRSLCLNKTSRNQYYLKCSLGKYFNTLIYNSFLALLCLWMRVHTYIRV